jgi:hypothetical protein
MPIAAEEEEGETFQTKPTYPPKSVLSRWLTVKRGLRHDFTTLQTIYMAMWKTDQMLADYEPPECLRDEFAHYCKQIAPGSRVQLGIGMCSFEGIFAVEDVARTTQFMQTVDAISSALEPLVLIPMNVRPICWKLYNGKECRALASFELTPGTLIAMIGARVLEDCFGFQLDSIINIGGSSVKPLLERLDPLTSCDVQSTGIHLTLMQTTCGGGSELRCGEKRN